MKTCGQSWIFVKSFMRFIQASFVGVFLRLVYYFISFLKAKTRQFDDMIKWDIKAKNSKIKKILHKIQA
jgi:hypothetical protein